MKQSLQFGLWWFFQSMKKMVVVFGVCIMVAIFSSGEGFGSENTVLKFLSLMSILFMWVLPSVWFLEGKQLMVSVGTTRKEFFLQAQLQKAFGLLIVLVCSLFGKDWAAVLSMVAVGGCLASVSETLSLMSIFFGKKGVTILTIVSAIVGAIAGIAIVSYGVSDLMMKLELFQTSLHIMLGLVAGVGLTAVNWLMFRRIDI